MDGPTYFGPFFKQACDLVEQAQQGGDMHDRHTPLQLTCGRWQAGLLSTLPC